MDRRHTIFLVDDNNVDLAIGKSMLKDYYNVYPAQSAHKLFDLLYNVVPDLILLDIEMPEMNGYEAMRMLNDDPRFMDIPVIFLTAASDAEAELEGLSLGALDFITKPFTAPILTKRIENALAVVSQRNELNNFKCNIKDIERKNNKQVVDIQNSVLNVLAELAELRGGTADGHVNRTHKYLELLLNQLIADDIYSDEISTWNLDYIYSSAQLHDVGKLSISDKILNKPSKLSIDEFNEMKKHPFAGVDTLRKIELGLAHDTFMRHARAIAGTHHEKWDGTGYPVGLRGEDIPLEGRLMAIVDVYDALISPRPYRRPVSCAEAERIIAMGSGTHFDPVLVGVFQKVAVQFAQIAAGHR
ncbi:MAG: response regulator [Oscillospiraceae bacterium]|nr:response regulator [Oscillospiraceae bacterium]